MQHQWFRVKYLLILGFIFLLLLVSSACGNNNSNTGSSPTPSSTPTSANGQTHSTQTAVPITPTLTATNQQPSPSPIPSPPPSPTPTYSSSPCITVSHNTFAFYSDSRGDYKQDTLILTNCGPTGSWGSVIGTSGPDSRIKFDMNPRNQPKDGSFPSGAQVTITVFVTADQTLPVGHYTGTIHFNVSGNGTNSFDLAIVNLTFDKG